VYYEGEHHVFLSSMVAFSFSSKKKLYNSLFKQDVQCIMQKIIIMTIITIMMMKSVVNITPTITAIIGSGLSLEFLMNALSYCPVVH
jgi:hypothetical protein